MATFNGTSKSNSLSDPIDSLESNFKSVVDYLMSHAAPQDKASEVKSNVASFTSKAGQAIKDHPIAALGFAFGLGYLFMRLIRR